MMREVERDTRFKIQHSVWKCGSCGAMQVVAHNGYSPTPTKCGKCKL
jgi:ribosomal protein L37AE/L43A